MRRLDEETEKRLNWLILPGILVGLIATVDLLFDLRLRSEDWIIPTFLAAFSIPLIGFSIAYIKQKCWGMLAISIVITIIVILKMLL